MADPISAAIAAIGAEIGGTAGATLIIYSTEIATAIAVAGAIESLSEQQRRARHNAQDQYNAGLQDRYVMSKGATEPRQLVLGRQRVSGPVVGPWSYGTFKEHLVYIVPLAAHEIDGIEAIYFDDEQILLSGTDVSGINRRDEFAISATSGTFTIRNNAVAGSVSAVAKYGTTTTALTVTSVTGTSVSVSGASATLTGTLVISYQPDPSPFAVKKLVAGAPTTIALDGSGNGSVVLSQPVVSAHVTYNPAGDPNGSIILDGYMGVSGNTVTVTGSTIVSTTVDVAWNYFDVSSRVRVRQYLGAPSQTADATMIANLPGVWTSAHVGHGIAFLIVEADFDQDSGFSANTNVSAQIRGAKVYDPRTGQTAWSENNALLMRHAATTVPWGPLDATLVGDTAIAAAANDCDVSSAYVVNGQTYIRPRYTAGLTVKAGTRCIDVLNDLAAAMAGKWTFIDGVMRVKAGSYSTPLQTLDEKWLAQGPTQMQPKANRSDVFNVVTGKFANEQQDYQVVDFPRVSASAYVSEDGRELPRDIQLNAVTFTGQAQQVAAVMLRDARQGLRISLSCNMRAFAVEPFDNLYVNLSRYGWVNKVFEVLDVSFSLDGGIVLALKETDASIWALGTSFAAADPAPNTLLPPPFQVPDIAGLAVASGSYTQANTEGMTATWTAVTDPGVTESGGGIEVRYGLATLPEAQWQSVTVPGSATKALLSSVRPGAIYLVMARAFKMTPGGLARGKWCLPAVHKAGAGAVVIDTLQLAADAATETSPNFSASGSVTTSVSGAGGEQTATAATSSWTNDTGETITVQVECQTYGWLTGNVGIAYFNLGWAIGGGSGRSDTPQSVTTGTEKLFSFIDETTVAAGQTITATITARAQMSSGTSVTCNWRAASCRVTAIKR